MIGNRHAKSLLSEKKRLDEVKLEDRCAEQAYVEKRIILSSDVHSIQNVVFKDCLFLKESFSELTISRCHFYRCRFIGCRFNDVEFHGCLLDNCLVQKPRFEKTYLDPDFVKFTLFDWGINAANINTTLFQRLESNFKNFHQDDFACKAHIQFRRYRRWQHIYQIRTGSLRTKAASTWNVVADIAYDIILGYGYGLFQALLTTVLLFWCGLLWIDYKWAQIKLASNSTGFSLDQDSSLQKLYFLVVTATTTGYGDITPHGTQGMIFVIVVMAISVIWTATLTALIVKRLVK